MKNPKIELLSVDVKIGHDKLATVPFTEKECSYSALKTDHGVLVGVSFSKLHLLSIVDIEGRKGEVFMKLRKLLDYLKVAPLCISGSAEIHFDRNNNVVDISKEFQASIFSDDPLLFMATHAKKKFNIDSPGMVSDVCVLWRDVTEQINSALAKQEVNWSKFNVNVSYELSFI